MDVFAGWEWDRQPQKSPGRGIKKGEKKRKSPMQALVQKKLGKKKPWNKKKGNRKKTEKRVKVGWGGRESKKRRATEKNSKTKITTRNKRKNSGQLGD